MRGEVSEGGGRGVSWVEEGSVVFETIFGFGCVPVEKEKRGKVGRGKNIEIVNTSDLNTIKRLGTDLWTGQTESITVRLRPWLISGYILVRDERDKDWDCE